MILAVLLVGVFLGFVSSSEYDGPWRKSLDGTDSCWKAPVSECNRVMTISHGGDWGADYPYDSFPAFQRAFDKGADAVKGDFRVSLDNVGMVMHSSPVEIYESPNCFGKYVEKMTADECEQCTMALSDFTFIRASTLLSWANSKVNVMFCVKEKSDVPRAITTLIENNASSRAFLEIGLSTLLDLQVTRPEGWDKVYYIANLGSAAEVNQFLTQATQELFSRAVLVEFNGWDDAWGTTLDADIASVHSAGGRTAAKTKDSPVLATVNNHLAIFNQGFDVAYTYNLTNAVTARVSVNSKHNITPP